MLSLRNPIVQTLPTSTLDASVEPTAGTHTYSLGVFRRLYFLLVTSQLNLKLLHFNAIRLTLFVVC